METKHQQKGHHHLPGPSVTYLLELVVGGTGVAQEAFGVEDAAVIVLDAPVVVARDSWER